MRKKGMLLALVSFMLILVAAGCGGNKDNNGASESAATSSQPTASSANADQSPGEIEKVVFYGDIKEFPSFVPMIAKLKEDFKGKYEIEMIQVDWGNLATVVKTGIASGTPADIYTFWPAALADMIKADMIEDLTPYLDENGGEWRNSFGSMLNVGKYNDKNYGIPISGVFPVIYANQDLLDQAGVTIPDNWNWDQFIDIMKQVKDKTGVYPFGLSNDPTIAAILPREGINSMGASQNKLKELAAQSIPATDPMFTTLLDNIKRLTEEDLWYPGKGALTIKREEEQSAFYQGKVAFLPEASSLVSGISENAKFKLATLPIPTMGAKLAYSGGADGFFIPSNAPHKAAAIEVLKKFTSPEYQQLHSDAGFVVSSSKVATSTPAVTQLSKLFDYVVSDTTSFIDTSAEMGNYMTKELLPNLLLNNRSNEDIINDIEALRLKALQK